ncbi:hypothetical protein ASPSYDRAFT_1010596 [Aspergillus sydowii CBS 593.65]|uniref:Uncharacterized protein n=1 Tax=Aspergillus sydowii CBS 593.65 TaxID=1036612 RepID=A0A1L9TEI9_9EURO|nr:uncharacterized protein ASPSYDRAFT_1010596 [Aspergillus sydowii CBS 593.65]OJJ57842.1 hypothetical protein ASPSYDRAFT_1010596 [Aspergillus sydowii CBS 593.65]
MAPSADSNRESGVETENFHGLSSRTKAGRWPLTTLMGLRHVECRPIPAEADLARISSANFFCSDSKSRLVVAVQPAVPQSRIYFWSRRNQHVLMARDRSNSGVVCFPSKVPSHLLGRNCGSAWPLLAIASSYSVRSSARPSGGTRENEERNRALPS